MAERAELEQTHCVISKVFAFTVPPLGSAEGFKATLWPKQPIWVGRLRVVSRSNKCAILLEHTDKEGLFASCPIQNEKTVEPTLDSSRYFVLRLSDGKGRHALIGIGFNDRAQAFDFKVALQDWQNANREGAPSGELRSSGPSKDYSIPEGGSIHVTFGGAPKRRKSSTPDVSAALAGMKLEGPPKSGEKEKKEKKEKKKKKEKSKDDRDDSPEGRPAAAPAAQQSVQSSSNNVIDFGFGDFSSFDPLSAPSKQASQAAGADAPRRASIDPFSAGAPPAFGASATPFDTPFDDTPADWVKF
jgi:hypothetical protein